jgi:hypothetical protein
MLTARCMMHDFVLTFGRWTGALIPSNLFVDCPWAAQKQGWSLILSIAMKLWFISLGLLVLGEHRCPPLRSFSTGVCIEVHPPRPSGPLLPTSIRLSTSRLAHTVPSPSSRWLPRRPAAKWRRPPSFQTRLRLPRTQLVGVASTRECVSLMHGCISMTHARTVSLHLAGA